MNSSIFSGKRWDLFVVLAWVTLFWGTVQTPAVAQNKIPLAYLSTGEYGVEWYPSEAYPAVTLRVSGPNGQIFEGTFNSTDSPPFFDFYDEAGNLLPDGNYQYELVAYPILDAEVVSLLAAIGDVPERSATLLALRDAGKLPSESPSQSGNFSFENGKVLMGNDHLLKTPKPSKGSISDADDPKVTKDIIHNDDVLITLSLCVGIDCVNGENFGADTIRLKENNLRIHFDDTSSTGSFPSNDWRIVANDQANGGANYLGFEDATAGRFPFRVLAGAPAHSLYVDSGGRVGFKTSTPAVELHSADGDTPALRLEQTGGSGFQSQTWDLAGNETNLFFRDVTNGSKLPFKIRPNTPTGSLDMTSSALVLNESGNNYDSRIESDNDPNMFFVDASADKLGIGTDAPSQKLTINQGSVAINTTTAGGFDRWVGANAHNAIAVDPNFGTMMSSSVSLKFFIDSDNNQASTNIQFRHNGRGSGGGVELMRIQDDGRVGIGNSSPSDLLEVGTGGAVCNGTTWMDGSSREYKKNIEELSADDIGTLYSILDQVKPVRFQYKQDPKDTPLRYGMIAEEMPDALASTDRKHLELGRHVGFLMAVVKDMNQQKEVMQEEIDELKHEIAALKERISGSQSD